MKEAIKELLGEIENISWYFQEGCIDPIRLSCFKDYGNKDQDSLINTAEKLLGDAFCALDKLCDMMKDEKQ